jgi:TPR repeat protein
MRTAYKTRLFAPSPASNKWNVLDAETLKQVNSPLYWGSSKTDVQWTKRAAENGNPGAQARLGVLQITGEGGIERNKRQGVEWLRKAAEGGHAYAQFNLGALYYKGENLEKNDKKAAEWFSKAADQGHPLSAKCLGSMYLRGEGVRKDIDKAFEWFEKAAETEGLQERGSMGENTYSAWRDN